MSESTERPGGPDRLPCGTRTDDLLTRVAEGRGEERDALRRPGAAPGRQARVTDDDASYRVAERAVVAVAGHAARTTPGVRMALGGLGGSRRTAGVGVSGGSVAIEVVVAADHGRDLHRLAGEVRARVHDAVEVLLGLEAVEIDDVLVPRG